MKKRFAPVYLSLIIAAAAQATTFVDLDERALAKRATAVVIGTVADVAAVADERTGGVNTNVAIVPDTVFAGTVPSGYLFLQEPGGRVADHAENILGAPEYAVGERVLVFVSRHRDGSLATTSLGLGKYTLEAGSDGSWAATRTVGEGVAMYDARQRRLNPRASIRTRPLLDIVSDVQAEFKNAGRPTRAASLPAEDPNALAEYKAPFALLQTARWFEPDWDAPITFYVDSTGEAGLGPAGSIAAVDAALAVWTDVSTANIDLVDGGTMSPQGFAGCGGPNRIVFNDPMDEVDDPSDCGGVLAIGGVCTSIQTTTFNGVSYERITRGKVTFNDKWDACGLWSQCELAEVATHEIGHAIGFAHSSSSAATMAPTIHFDGRCAGLATDDMAAVSYLYGLPLLDTVTDRHNGMKVTIPKGQSSVTKPLSVKARNADATLAGASSYRFVQMVARDGDCPPGTVSGADFEPTSFGTQDVAYILKNSSKKARINVTFSSAAIDTPNPKIPARCTIEVEAQALAESSDLSPTNNILKLPIDIVDANDANTGLTLRDSIIENVTPRRISIGRGTAAKTATVIFKVRNADLGIFPDHIAHVAASDGDCPAGTVSGALLLPALADTAPMAPLGRLTGTLTLNLDAAAFLSASTKSPGRCTATVSVDGLPGELNLSNNTAPVVIDVIDHNDY